MLLLSTAVFATPLLTTYQAKIIKPDGYPLESANVNFKFTVLDPAGSCILFSEIFTAVNMQNSGGLVSMPLGSGIVDYSASGTASFASVFNNSAANLACMSGSTYNPLVHDIRKVVMQFNDGNGWQTLPALSINAVPYAIYAYNTQLFGGVSASSYVRHTTIPTCTASEALTYNNGSFTCIGAGSLSSITSSDVTNALGYTPSDVSTVQTSFTTVTGSLSTLASSYTVLTSTVGNLSASVTALAANPSLQSLNGSTSSTQSFAIGFSGAAPMVNTSNGVHTFNIPLASVGTTTAGLISNSDYLNFTNKLNATSSSVVATLGYVPVASGSITSSQWVTSGTTINYMNGNVGIGTSNPLTMFHLREIDDSWNSSIRIDRSYDSDTDYVQMMYDFEGFKLRTMENNDGDDAHIIFKPRNVEAFRIKDNGLIGIGVTNPTALLNLTAGTNTVAPLKLTSGTLLSSPQSGTIEYDGFNFYITNGFNTRRSIATVQTEGSFDNTNMISNSSGNITLAPNNAAGSVIVSATTASTNSQTGALIVNGGLGVAGNINSSGTVTATGGVNTNVVQGNMNLLLNPNGGNVGIGITNPSQKLDVIGRASLGYGSSQGIVIGQSPTSIPANDSQAYISWGADSVFGGTNGDLIYIPRTSASGSHRFYSANGTAVERMRIDASGNVGIGTANPQDMLTVGNATGSIIRMDNVVGSRSWRLLSNNSSGVFAIRDETAATNRLSISTSGIVTVGLAVSAPANVAKLSIADDGTATGDSRATVNVFNNRTTGSTSGRYSYGNAQGINFWEMSTDYIGNGGNNWYLFGGGTPRIYVDGANGNVGIGTTTPQNKLMVVGVAGLPSNSENPEASLLVRDGGNNWLGIGNSNSGNWIQSSQPGIAGPAFNLLLNPAGGNVGIGTSSPVNKLQIGLNSAGYSGNDFAIGDNLGNSFAIRTTSSTSTLYSTDNFTFMPSGPGATGNVGIGTTTPTSRLHVVGDSNFQGNIILGGLSSSVTLNDVVPGFALPAQGTRVAVFNLPIGSVCKVSLFSSENNVYQPIELDISRQNAVGSIPAIIRTGKKIHTHSDDIAFSADASGDVWMEKVDFVTGRVVTVKKVEILKGSCTILPATTTAAGVGADQSVRDTGYFTANSFGIYHLGNVGIGTTNPTLKLQVSGTASVDDKLWASFGNQLIRGYSWVDAALTTNSIEIVNSNTLDATKAATLAFHTYGFGGPQFRLDPNGSKVLYLESSNANSARVATAYGGGANSYFTRLHIDGNLSTVGNIGVGTIAPSQKLHVVGDARIQGSVTDCYIGNGSGGTSCSSDARLKENIKPIPYALEKINSLKGVEFDWNTLSRSQGRHDIGVIAQDVEKVFPTAVSTGDDGYKKVDYAVLVAPLIQAVKELYNLILSERAHNRNQDRQIASKVDRLELENVELKKKVLEFDTLKSYLCSKDPAAPVCKQ